MDPITNNQMNSMYQAPLGQQPVLQDFNYHYNCSTTHNNYSYSTWFWTIKNKEEKVKMIRRSQASRDDSNGSTKQAAIKAQAEADANILSDIRECFFDFN